MPEPAPTHPCGIHRPATTPCPTPVPDDQLLCGWHWRFVPRDLQRAVYRTRAAGTDPDAHAAACRRARQAVEQALMTDATAPRPGYRRR
jgi:hypothetical protein